MIISFIILAIALMIYYFSDIKNKKNIILISVFIPLSYLVITILFLSIEHNQYYAGERIAGSIIPIFLSGIFLYNNLNNKIQNKNKTPFFLIFFTVFFFVLAIIEIKIRN
jgi:hypothetical protein